MTGKLVLTVILISLVCSLASMKPVFCSTSDTKIGLFYYVWYGEYDEQNKTGRHWNDSEVNTVIDKPILGYYNSQNATIIKQHLDWFKELNISFLIISWWGPDSYEDGATKSIFSMVKQYGYPIEITLMVEAYNWSGLYDFQAICNYINETYVTPYESIYMKLDGLPLVCFFNDNINMTRTEANRTAIRSVTGFTPRIVGHSDYVDWWAWPIAGYTEAPKPKLSRDGYIGILPRYDDTHLPNRTNTMYDVNYTEGLYDEQWNETLKTKNESTVNFVAIYSWNEYHERSQIEPCVDKTSEYASDPYFLYDKTRKYIRILKRDLSFSFAEFVEEIFENVKDLSENQCRCNAVNSEGYRLDTIKVIENPYGGYLGVYHFDSGGIFQVRLANSTDLLKWTLIGTLEQHASQATIAGAPNGAYIVAFEKRETDGNSYIKFQYYSDLPTLLSLVPNATLDTSRNLSRTNEGTPNIYNITIQESTMRVCVGFHFLNNTIDLDRVAAGWLSIPLDNPRNMIWGNVTELCDYNEKLVAMGVQGKIGDRDYGQIFGRNYTLQEAQLCKNDWSSWRIFLYDHITENFMTLNIKTPKGSTSFGNPTFTCLRSPSGKDVIVVTYFLFREGGVYGEGAELIFYKEINKTEQEIIYQNKTYGLTIYSNSTISNFNFTEANRIISFNATGPNGSMGYCIINFSTALVQNLWQGNYTVLINGEPCPFENWTNMENTYLYINYVLSELNVTIIPEFSSTILPLFMIATLLAVIVYKRKHFI